jgi:hypothetical protein
MLLVLAGVIVVYGAASAFLWRPIVREVLDGESPQLVIKNFYLGDQFAYMGIAKNVADGGIAYAEPYTATGDSIYPSGYFWVLGKVSAGLNLTIFGGWNLLGLAVTLALFLASGWWCWWVSKRSWAWLLGPLPAIVGTWHFFVNSSWKSQYRDNAVLWPGYANLFSPGAEPCALLLVGVGIFYVLKGFSGSARKPAFSALVGGALLGLALNVHSYVPIFGFVAAMWGAAVLSLSERGVPRHRVPALVAIVSALIVGSALAPGGFTVLRLLCPMLIGAVIPIVIDGFRGPMPARVGAFALGAGVAAIPIGIRIARDAMSEESFFVFRSGMAKAEHRSLPLDDVLLHTIPLLILVVGAVVVAWRDRLDSRSRIWMSALVGLFVATALLTFNAAWGVNQEPYRFLAYGQILLAAVAAPFLVVFPRLRLVNVAVYAVVVGLLLSTIPTAKTFADATDTVLRVGQNERAAYEAVAAEVGEGLALLDGCLPRGAFKAITGTSIAAYNRGVALPADFEALNDVLINQRRGVLPDDAALRAAGITAFMTHSHCAGSGLGPLIARFGAPLTIPLSAPAECGFAEGLDLFVFRIPEASSGAAVPWVPRVGAPAPGRCALSQGNDDLEPIPPPGR